MKQKKSKVVKCASIQHICLSEVAPIFLFGYKKSYRPFEASSFLFIEDMVANSADQGEEFVEKGAF
jgi:hypothetical protein